MKISKLLKSVVIASAVMSSPARADWVEAKSKHFTIYGDISEGRAAQIAREAEMFDQLLRQYAKTPDRAPTPTDVVEIYAVPQMSSLQSFGMKQSIAGFYNGSAQSTVAVIPLTLPSQISTSPTQVLFHEYTHHIMLNSTPTQYPSWVQEGLAEFFGATTFRSDGMAILGNPLADRRAHLVNDNILSVEEMLDTSRKLSDEEISDKYAKGWLLVHYLMFGGQRKGQFDAYLNLLNAGRPSVEAGREAFGDLGKLNTELRSYNRGSVKSFLIPTSNLNVGTITTRKLSDCESAIMPLRARSAAGVDEARAKALIEPARAVAARCANNAFVERSLAEMEFDAKNNVQAAAAADKTLALDPNNRMAVLYKGRVLARERKFDEARALFIKANRMEPDYALPLVLYYDSFVSEGKAVPAAAMDGLGRAAILVPQDESIRLRLADAWIKGGALKEAYDLLKPYRETPGASRPGSVASVMALIDKGATKDQVLAEMQKGGWKDLSQF